MVVYTVSVQLINYKIDTVTVMGNCAIFRRPIAPKVH